MSCPLVFQFEGVSHHQNYAIYPPASYALLKPFTGWLSLTAAAVGYGH
ncbi:MAG: hypothetical protein R3C26_14900 [Calditrichia bacterium]